MVLLSPVCALPIEGPHVNVVYLSDFSCKLIIN